MLRLDDDRAEGNVVRIRHALVIHRDAEEAGDAQGLALRSDLLQMSPERFLPLVNATQHLELRQVNLGGRDGRMSDHGIEHLRPEATFEGQMVDPLPLANCEGLDLVHQAGPFVFRLAMHLFGLPPRTCAS